MGVQSYYRVNRIYFVLLLICLGVLLIPLAHAQSNSTALHVDLDGQQQTSPDGFSNQIQWVFTVNNAGDQACTNLAITNDIDPRLDVLQVSANLGEPSVSIDGDYVLLTLPSLAPGELMTVNVLTQSQVTNTILSNSVEVQSSCGATSDTAQITLLTVNVLPATGQPPWWRSMLQLVMAVGGFAIIWHGITGLQRD